MNEDDMALFEKNFIWFKKFFSDIRQLYDLIVENLRQINFLPDDFTLSASKNLYGNPYSKAYPLIQDYHMMGIEGETHAFMFMSFFNKDLFGSKSMFVKEPSFLVILHGQKDEYLEPTHYGLKLIQSGNDVEITSQKDGKFQGIINWPSDSDPPTKFFAFQIPFKLFGKDNLTKGINDVIKEEIIEPVKDYLQNYNKEAI